MPAADRGTTGGRRSRLRSNEVRERMLAAALEMVAETGLTVSLAHLSYEDVIVKAMVPRSAGYRIWPTKEDFFDHLLCELAGAAWGGTAAFGEEAVQRALVALADRADMLDTVEGRRAAWMYAARESAETNLRHLMTQTRWRTYVTMAATILSLPQGPLRQRVQGILRESEQTFLQKMASLYTNLGAQVGFRMRPETGSDFTIIAATGAALVEGLGLRMILSPDIVERSFDARTFGEGAPTTWTPVSLGLVALIDSLIEPDPDFDESNVPLIQQRLREQSASLRPVD